MPEQQEKEKSLSSTKSLAIGLRDKNFFKGLLSPTNRKVKEKKIIHALCITFLFCGSQGNLEDELYFNGYNNNINKIPEKIKGK